MDDVVVGTVLTDVDTDRPATLSCAACPRLLAKREEGLYLRIWIETGFRDPV